MNKTLVRWAAAGMIAAMLAATPMYGPAVADSIQGGTAMAAEAAGTVQRTITVTGEGKVKIQPDVAYVNFGVFTRADTANEAQSLNAKAFAAIEKVLKEQYKVAAADIKTSGFYVNPEYSYPADGQPKVTGYTANHDVVVAYRDLDALGGLLDAVSKAGANRVNGIQFGTEKTDEYELQAIEGAMADAKRKADTIAKASGRSVQGVLNVQLGWVNSGGPIVYPYAAKMDAASEAAGVSTSVQPGELDITTTVTVTYEM